MAIEKNDDWVNFINLYKNLPELWNIENDRYKNRAIRVAAYKKLTNVYKNIDEHATIEKVKNRIRNMRFAYKRELKKKISSDMYEPNLWYFNEFNFLRKFFLREEDIRTITYSDDNSILTKPLKPAKRKKLSESYERNELPQKSTLKADNLDKCKERDEADIYAEGWAYSYRKLTNSQKLFAKKACDEIFILGQLGKLSLNTVKTEMSSYPSSLNYRSSSCSSLH